MAISPWNTSLSGFSIHRIDANRRIFSECKIAEHVVKVIIHKHSENSEDKPTCNYLDGWNPNDHFNFGLKIYSFKKESCNHFGKFLRLLGSEESFEEVSYYFICFIYRDRPLSSQAPLSDKKKWDVFALTLGEGWRFVKTFCDYTFPIKIALRIVDPNVLTVEKKPLAGHKEASTETYRQAYSLEPHELDTLWHIFKQFQAPFKRNSSIYNLLPFKDCDDLIGVKVGNGKILIIKKLPFDGLPIILDHFSKIYRGEETVQVDESLETDDSSFKYLSNISPVDEETSHQLTQKVVELIHKCLENESLSLDFSFSHRYYKDFLSSYSFELIFEETRVRKWSYPPTIHQILTALKEALKGRQINDQALTKKMHFKYGTSRTNYHLLDFFQGELRDRERQKTYFHNDGIWLSVKASHIVVLQHDFHSLLTSCLIRNQSSLDEGPGALTHSWIAKEHWAAFSLQQAIDAGLSPKGIEQALKILQTKTFVFVNEKGFVKNSKPTFCLLEYADNLTQTIEKKWAELSLLLSEKYERNECVLIEDLKSIFPDKKPSSTNEEKSMSSTAQKVQKFLTKSQPFCAPPKNGKTTKAPNLTILSPEGLVLLDDISNCVFKSASLRNNCEWVQEQLKNSKGKVLDRNAFINKLAKKRTKSQPGRKGKPIGEENATRGFEELQKPIPIKTNLTGLFCIRALIPDYILCDLNDEKGLILTFLNNHYETYSNICKEEGYNRSYLGREDYIVGDQLYADKREKIELFDILYHDKKEKKLYLYHVKEEFGQPTRAACAQIRAAAHVLSSDMASGSFDMLKQFHKNCMGSNSSSAFRKEVKKQFKSSEELISLFRDTKPANIIFVYAFIDTAEKERRLEEEQNPTYQFTERDFLPETLGLLKEKGYLDKEGKLTAHRLRSTKKQFKEIIDTEDSSDIFDTLQSKISRFDSMSAKVELLHLRDELTHKNPAYSFGFKICQIRREENFHDFRQTVLSDIKMEDLGSQSTENLEEDDKAEACLLRTEESEINDIPNTPPPIRGISNTATDCFLNATLQLIIHTSLFKLFIEEKKFQGESLDTSQSPPILKKPYQDFYKSFKNFASDYFKTDPLEKPCSAPANLRAYLSQLDVANPERLKKGHQDPSEIFDLYLGKCYLTDGFNLSFQTKKVIDRASQVLRKETLKKEDYSEINEDGEVICQEDEIFMLKLAFPKEENPTFETCYNLFLNDPHEERYTYLDKDNFFEAKASESKTLTKAPKKGLLVSFKRFEKTKESNKLTKRKTSIKFASEIIDLEKAKYTLSFFIEHTGDCIENGHYVAYGKIKDKWYLFDDDKKPEEKNASEILTLAAQAYVLYFDPC